MKPIAIAAALFISLNSLGDGSAPLIRTFPMENGLHYVVDKSTKLCFAFENGLGKKPAKRVNCEELKSIAPIARYLEAVSSKHRR